MSDFILNFDGIEIIFKSSGQKERRRDTQKLFFLSTERQSIVQDIYLHSAIPLSVSVNVFNNVIFLKCFNSSVINWKPYNCAIKNQRVVCYNIYMNNTAMS